MVSRIVTLSFRIASNTGIVSRYLEARGLPLPSFDVDGPSESLIPRHEPEIEAARVAMIDDTQELRRLVLGPRDYLRSFHHNELLGQQAIVRFRLAQAVPIGQCAKYDEIAKASGLDEVDVRRLLRLAITQNIFAEPRPGHITHTSVSRLLAEDRLLSDWVASSTDDLWQAAAQTCNAMAKFPGSQEPVETGFSLAYQTDKPIYETFSQYPERARRFANAMQSYTRGSAFDLSHLVDNYHWGDFTDGLVVDVGGSLGFACFAIGRRYRSLSFVVQDLEPVIEAATNRDTFGADIGERISFMVHDFHTPQPIHGADVYIFRWVLHNWSDQYCIRILQNLIPSLKHGAVILVNDMVLPRPGESSNWHETRIRSRDLTMKEIQNSCERELDDWVKIFEKADPRFHFQSGVQPKDSALWIMTAKWVG